MARQPLVVGQQVRDILGHWWTVVEVINPWQYRVQSNDLHHIVRVGRSELRADGE